MYRQSDKEEKSNFAFEHTSVFQILFKCIAILLSLKLICHDSTQLKIFLFFYKIILKVKNTNVL